MYSQIIKNRDGFTLFLLLAAIVLIEISVSIGVKQWKTIVQREKEAELLFRGEQIRRGIEAYYNKPGAHQFPAALDYLVGGAFGGPRFLRRLYKDPMTNGEWELIGINDLIMGVRSTSTAAPLKAGQFPERYKCFEQAKTYQDWTFLYIPQAPLSICEVAVQVIGK
jgi:type II secretory pathway pseudopilin PulG